MAPRVIVIGVGASGIGALDRLRAAGIEALGLEARATLGGRALTVDSPAGPLDLGCEWLHSADRNVLAARFQALGLDIDPTAPRWGREAFGPGSDPASRASFQAAFAQFEGRLAASAARGEDRPAADLLDPRCAWNGRLDAVSGYYNGASWDEVSTLDYDAYVDTGVNWRVRTGYGAALRALAAGLQVRCGAPARRVAVRRKAVRVEGEAGGVEAEAVIVAVPTAILARGLIRFDPEVEGLRQAAADTPLGLADKVFLSVERAEDLPEEAHLLGRLDRAETGSYHLRPLGRPVIEAFFGGRGAEALEAAGPGAAAAFAIEELVARLGSGFRRRLKPLVATAWRREPWIFGSYSHARPGRAGARRRLAEPACGRIFFAGEAAHASFFSTAHGAFEVGAAAAEAALGAIGAAPSPGG